MPKRTMALAPSMPEKGGLPNQSPYRKCNSTISYKQWHSDYEYTSSSLEKCPWAFKYNQQLWPVWALTQDRNCIH